MSERRLPYYGQFKYKKDGAWTEWIDVLPKSEEDLYEFEYFMWTLDEAKAMNEWKASMEEFGGIKGRFITDSKMEAEIKYLDQFFDL